MALQSKEVPDPESASLNLRPNVSQSAGKTVALVARVIIVFFDTFFIIPIVLAEQLVHCNE